MATAIVGSAIGIPLGLVMWWAIGRILDPRPIGVPRRHWRSQRRYR